MKKGFIRVVRRVAEVIFVIFCGFVAVTNGSTLPIGLTFGVVVVGTLEIALLSL
jgi:hypothetical protein